MNVQLPPIDKKKKWQWAASGYLGFCLLYTLTGNLHLRSPVPPWPSAIDDWLPFTGWTIWIYHSQLVFLLLCIAAIQRPGNLRHTVYSLTLACLLSFAIFLLYPTTIARPEQAAGGLNGKAFQLLYAIDNSTNCFPSLHVSLACLGAAAVLSERRNLGLLLLLWALLISLSTLTTKQHYFIDALGGLAVAAVSRLLVAKYG
jgi:membrane-associated phospholipid phosphatase